MRRSDDPLDLRLPDTGAVSRPLILDAPSAPTPQAAPEAAAPPRPTSALEALKQRLHAPGPSRVLGEWRPS